MCCTRRIQMIVMRHLKDMFCLFVFLVASIGFASAVRAQEPFEAFLAQHCVRCHGPDTEEGGLRVDQLSRDFTSGVDAQYWAEVIERINAGEMPPEDEPEPTQQEISAFVTRLDARIKEGKAARMAARPPVAHYRMSRKEYQNTIYDLLGVHYDPTQPGELNEDTLWHGYERIGSELSLSSSHVERYYRAAELAVERAFPAEPTKTRKFRKSANWLRYRRDDLSEYQKKWLDGFGIKRPLRYLLVDGMPHSGEKLQMAFSPEWIGKDEGFQPGLYRMRLQASGIRPPGGPLAHLRIGELSPSNIVDDTITLDITAPEDEPEVYEVDILLERPVELHFDVVNTESIPKDRKGGAFSYAIGIRPTYMFTHSSETRTLNRNAPQVFDDKGNAIYPTVLVDWIEWEGPVETEAEKARRRGLLPPEEASEEEVAQRLQVFAERAWRRPVEPEELAGCLEIYRSEREAGETTVAAFKVMMKAVLTSRHFIYLVEGEPQTQRDHLTDSELASRLSYFLWSSMPDERLLTAAKEGTLRGDGLASEVDRLLSDRRADRFIEDFPRQWLQLHRVGMFPPDGDLYPRYDLWLENSLGREPIEFFREIFVKNLPLAEFIHSEWTMADARLCDFYGLPEPKGSGFQRVSLKPEDNRGGLLTMGGVLGLTSDGTRHRPVHRGVWISEAIFNKTPPPPPANVDPIAPVPPEGDKVTVRQRLIVHAINASCASCHSQIDPLGFAWDHYDAIGQWRTRERVTTGKGEDPLVDASGVMPDGRRFNDSNQFKQLLLEDRDRFLRAFIEHLSTYALRRVLTVDDQDQVQAIVEAAKRNQYGLRDIVRAVALSDLIQKR
jgi:hypothetical protein